MYEPALSITHNAALLDVLSQLTHLQTVMLRGNHDDERQPNLLYDFIDKLKVLSRPRSVTNHPTKGSRVQGGFLQELRVVMIWTPSSRNQWGTTFIREDAASGAIVGGFSVLSDWAEYQNVPMSLMEKTRTKGEMSWR